MASGTSPGSEGESVRSMLFGLCEILLDQTRQGLVNWSPADRAGTSFVMSTGSASVAVQEDTGSYGQTIVAVSVLDGRGVTLTTSNSEMSESSDAMLLNDLYEAVRVNALKPDVVIREIVERLTEEKNKGKKE
jgi:hypothetical protein